MAFINYLAENNSAVPHRLTLQEAAYQAVASQAG